MTDDTMINRDQVTMDWCPTIEHRPTPNLKFIDGRLHQQFQIITYGRDFKVELEWREVPSETTEKGAE